MKRQSTILSSLRVMALVTAVTALCVSCLKKETVTTVPDIAGDWVSPSAITAVTPDSTFYLLGYDGMPVGDTNIEGMPVMAFNDVFACNVDGEFYVYNTAEPRKRLNSEPFDNITDFRTGYAYATRPGCPLMVVNRLGAVVRVLPERISQISTSDFMTEQYASARFTTDDECTGILRPNGEVLIEFGRNETCGFLNDNRITVYNSKTKKTRVVDSTGKEIYVLDDGLSFTGDNYTSGWIGVVNEDHTHAYFADTDGNPAMVLDDGYLPLIRLGDFAIIASGDDENATYTVKNIADNQTLCTNVDDLYPVFGSNMELLYIVRTDTSGDSVIEIIDSQGKTQNKMRLAAPNYSFSFGDNIGLCESDEFTIFNYRTGKRVSGKTYSVVAFNHSLEGIGNLNTTYNDYAALLASYISQQGMMVDNYLYTSATTPTQIIKNAGYDLTDDRCAIVFKSLYDDGWRSLNLDIDDSRMIFTFNSFPYIETERQVPMGYYNITNTELTMNPDCRLQTVSMVIDLGSDITQPLISKTIDYLTENSGFTRRADMPNTVNNGYINVMFIPTKTRLFITVAFTEIDKDRLSALLNSSSASYDPDADYTGEEPAK